MNRPVYGCPPLFSFPDFFLKPLSFPFPPSPSSHKSFLASFFLFIFHSLSSSSMILDILRDVFFSLSFFLSEKYEGRKCFTRWVCTKSGYWKSNVVLFMSTWRFWQCAYNANRFFLWNAHRTLFVWYATIPGNLIQDRKIAVRKRDADKKLIPR